MSWTTHFLNLCDWYIHLLCTSPTKSIHFHVFDNITSNPNTSTTSSRPKSKLADSFDLASKLSVQRAMSSLPLI
ncbi:hypothetical protein Ahy_A10g049872 [Arachis hypogaea]|uniref:Uncharacterized protein n=1 Tax=Arachis hypogaea TaxID=3818 RepID=A0A445B835_ARAHY|nr:hypothetical protein Ahy_A10g049872 [Arachis hypogaea]